MKTAWVRTGFGFKESNTCHHWIVMRLVLHSYFKAFDYGEEKRPPKLDNEREASAKLFDGISDIKSMRCLFNWSSSNMCRANNGSRVKGCSVSLDMEISRWFYLSFQLWMKCFCRSSNIIFSRHHNLLAFIASLITLLRLRFETSLRWQSKLSFTKSYNIVFFYDLPRER